MAIISEVKGEGDEIQTLQGGIEPQRQCRCIAERV
jgi:hypothetical protein